MMMFVIVLSTAREPIPGWTDNLYGPTGLSMGTSYGLVRIFFGNKDSRADTVPVDMVVAALITSAAYLIKDRSLSLLIPLG
jgi:fatty acyl-CoA reductase